jgi:lipopolysaccharide export LptBFGC system permease protein LptF
VDFLVGDTPELFVGAVVAVGLGFAWRAAGGSVATMVWLPLAVVVVLGLSLLRAVRRH